jgi:hypothetical protein
MIQFGNVAQHAAEQGAAEAGMGLLKRLFFRRRTPLHGWVLVGGVPLELGYVGNDWDNFMPVVKGRYEISAKWNTLSALHFYDSTWKYLGSGVLIAMGNNGEFAPILLK